jgi:hypothetical protein
MSLYKSRKRLTEQAVKATLQTFAGTHLDGVQILIGRETLTQEVTNIRIHCGTSYPVEDETAPISNYKVDGQISVEQSIDDNTRDEISTLEGIIESYIEQDTEDIVAALDGSGVQGFGCWEFQPGQCEDGLDEDKRKFLSTYTFTAVIGRQPYNPGE